MNKESTKSMNEVLNLIRAVLEDKSYTNEVKKAFIDKVLDDVKDTAIENIKEHPLTNNAKEVTTTLVNNICSLARQYGLNY